LAAGPLLEHRLRDVGEVPVGSAFITPAEQLDASFLIHLAVEGPGEAPTPAILRRALLAALRHAQEWGVVSLAMPPLGGGAGGVDPEADAEATLPLLKEALARSEHLADVEIVLAGTLEEEAFRSRL